MLFFSASTVPRHAAAFAERRLLQADHVHGDVGLAVHVRLVRRLHGRLHHALERAPTPLVGGRRRVQDQHVVHHGAGTCAGQRRCTTGAVVGARRHDIGRFAEVVVDQIGFRLARGIDRKQHVLAARGRQQLERLLLVVCITGDDAPRLRQHQQAARGIVERADPGLHALLVVTHHSLQPGSDHLAVRQGQIQRGRGQRRGAQRADHAGVRFAARRNRLRLRSAISRAPRRPWSAPLRQSLRTASRAPSRRLAMRNGGRR